MTMRAVACFLPSLGGGGAERAIVNLAIGLSERGVPVDLVLAEATGPYLAQVPSAVRVIDLHAPRVLRALPALAGYLRKERPTALLSALNYASLVAMAAARVPGSRTRVAIWIQNTIGPGRGSGGVREQVIPWLMGRLHRWADAIVAVSEGVADDVTRTTGIPRHRISVIYNPVITASLLPSASAPPSHPWFEDGSRPVVLGVGRLTRQKNFPALLEAFARVRQRHDARLVILGEGPDRPALEAQVRRLGLEAAVSMPGFVDNPFACMSRAAVFALSSDWEGLPTVLIESLAVGTPVVATDCESGPREILSGGALGELVPTRDVEALADAISRALCSRRPPPPREALSRFSVPVILDQFQDVLGVHA